MDAIILAGGLGTRLQSVVSDVPKCMAIVNGVPFLEYVLHYGYQQGITKFILSVGYKSEIIEEYISKQHYPFTIVCSKEIEPLGTGGAILNSLVHTTQTNVLVLNGDTYFAYTLNETALLQFKNNVSCTLFLKEMEQIDRYGIVTTDGKKITAFYEKQFVAKGLINTGVYILNTQHFATLKLNNKFSFEKDYLEKYVQQLHFEAIPQNGYFIDIGIPTDYAKAQIDLKNKL